MFFMQSPSFLSHEQDRKRERGKNNLESLFGVHETLSTNQLKNILDLMPPKEMGKIFWTVYDELLKADYLEDFRSIDGTFLCGMDGTEYHSSYKVYCENCNRKQKGEKVLCTHNVIAPVIVAPGRSDVVSLEMEISDSIYKAIRHEFGSRKTFWADVRALLRYQNFHSWTHLMHFMFTQLELEHPPPHS